MFIAKRRAKAIETFALADEEGNIVKKYDVDCDPETRLIEYTRAKNRVIRAEQIIAQEPSEDSYEAYGQAVLDMMGVFFGAESTQEILDFFDGRYAEMLLAVLPFVRDVLEPKMREISDKQMQEARKRRDK